MPAVLAAFDHHTVVALGMSHWQQDEADFALSLVRDASFPTKVDDVVVECGNARYQDVLDRYVAGEAVTQEALQRVWRDTTQPGRCDPRQHPELLAAVREVNQRLPAARRLRVLAGDPPIDWQRIQRTEDMAPFVDQRDTHFAAIVEREVLARHRKALLVIGAAHVLRHGVSWHNDPHPPAATVTQLLEEKSPRSTFVIIPHDGFGSRTAELEGRLGTWKRPSLAALGDTWLGSLGAGIVFSGNIRRVGSDPSQVEDPYPGLRLQDLADAFLYLGPVSALARVEWPSQTEPTYAHELERRLRLSGMAPVPR